MTGKTHMAVGVGSANLLLHTNDIKTIISGTILAVVGSYIVDVDTSRSKASTFLRNIIGVFIIGAALGILLKLQYKINVFSYITQNKTLNQMLPALSIFLIALVVGVMSKHRTFTHSIIGFIVFTFSIYLVVGDLYKWFAVGYIAHILLDMLNHKEVKLLHPFKKGISLGLCDSEGIFDKLIFFGFVGISFLQLKFYLGL